MIIPIVAYGTKVLKQKAEEISSDYPNLEQLIEDMFETMYEASGVGLAAPQIGRSIRLFIVDGSPFADEDADMEGFQGIHQPANSRRKWRRMEFQRRLFVYSKY